MQFLPDSRVETAPSYRAARQLAWGIQAGVALLLFLLGFGWRLVPAVVPIPPAAVLIAYAVVASLSVPTIGRGGTIVARITLACGVVSAAVLTRALVVQYFGHTANNAVMVAIVFGLWLVPGVVTAARTGRIRDAAMTSTLSAEIGSLANVGFILMSYYVLRGTALQQQFFRTEGTYDDFARSGMSDFGTFVMGDLFGGAFFHLLLGGLSEAVLGTLGGALTVGIRRILRSQSTLDNLQSTTIQESKIIHHK